MNINTADVYDKIFNDWNYIGKTTAPSITISDEGVTSEFSVSLNSIKVEKPKRIKQKKKKKPYFERAELKVVNGFGSYCIAHPNIKKVIFNEPATIVLWKDGSKTVVRCRDGEHFDRWTGLAMCFMKKIFGDEFHHVMKTYAGEEEK